MKAVPEVAIDNVKVYHEVCSSWCASTKMGVSNHHGRSAVVFEALCFKCGIYFQFKMFPFPWKSRPEQRNRREALLREVQPSES